MEERGNRAKHSPAGVSSPGLRRGRRQATKTRCDVALPRLELITISLVSFASLFAFFFRALNRPNFHRINCEALSTQSRLPNPPLISSFDPTVALEQGHN